MNMDRILTLVMQYLTLVLFGAIMLVLGIILGMSFADMFDGLAGTTTAVSK